MQKYFNLIFSFLLFIVVSHLALAADMDTSQKIPINIEADQLYYDKVKKVAYATGNVVLTQEDQLILADELTYFKDTQIAYAYKNVVLVKGDGNVYFADSARIDRNHDEGIALNFKGRMAKQGLIAAKGAKFLNKNNMELEEFVYSPCKVCSDNFVSNTPLWQIRAKNAELNKEEERIYYKNATLESFGVPIFYTPFFSTPAPGAKRKSGFLAPKFFMNKELGVATKLPYYLNIAPNMDVTYSPTYFSKSGLLSELEFRHKLKFGSYKLNTSLIRYNKVDQNGNMVRSKKEFRGHYDLKGEFAVKQGFLNGYLDVEAKQVKDKAHTYLKKYKINHEDVLKSDINYRQFHKNDYYSIRALRFQDLRPDASVSSTASAMPVIESSLEEKTNFYNSNLYANFNAINLTRAEGLVYQRLSVKPGWKVPVIFPYGQQASINTSVRGDIYNVNHNGKQSSKNSKGSEGRLYPEMYSEWSWPLFNSLNNYYMILEPVVGVALAPALKDLKKPGNQDSQDPEISAVNLFSTNRFRGFDKIESGNRVNYGVRGHIKAPYFKNLNFLMGQVIRSDKDKNFNRGSGLEEKRSDFVSSISLQLDDSINLSNRARLNEKNFGIMRNETNFIIYKPTYNVSVTYANVNTKLLDLKVPQYKQELLTRAGYNLYKEYWLDGYMHTRLGKKIPTQQTRFISNGVSLQYRGDCLLVELGIVRTYTNLKDLKPTTTPTINFIIPTF